jgi:predicted dehydrogenase
MTRTRIAVAGLGNAAGMLHLPAIAGIGTVELAGGCDPREEARSAAATRWKIPVFETHGELLAATSPDILVVVTPPSSHRAVAIAGFESGANVICEKPMAGTLGDADAMIAAATSSGRKLALNHEFRVMPAYKAVLDAVRADAAKGAGPSVVQAWQLMDLPPWKEKGWRSTLMGGVLFEAGIHLIDYVMALFGECPLAVTAIASSCGERDEESDAVASITMEFPGGRIAQVLQHRLCRGETQYFEVRADTRSASYRVSYGGRARLTAGLLRSRTPHLRFETGKSGLAWREEGDRRFRLAANPGNAPMLATRQLIVATIEAFTAGTRPPATAQDGRDVLAVIAACYRSAAIGARVRLDELSASTADMELADGVRAAR